jgi:DNA mismatch endonuclease, patch repair protein
MERKLREQLRGGKFENVDPIHAHRMSSVRGKGTKTTERRFRAVLVRAGVRGWSLHPKGILGHPDLFFAARRVVVFLDGCFWHGCPACGHTPSKNRLFWSTKIERNRQRDAETTCALKASGFTVLRFWEHEIRNAPEACLARLLSHACC